MKEINIVALGDSITYGYPYTPEVSWPFIAEQRTNLRIINKGINGDTLEGMLDRFDEDVKSFSPDILVVMGGTNDAFGDYSISSMEHSLKEILKRAIGLSIQPIVGIPIPTDDPSTEKKLSKFRELILGLCVKNHIPVIDFYSVMVDKSGLIKKELNFDGVHPSRQGYLVMAEIAELILDKVVKS